MQGTTSRSGTWSTPAEHELTVFVGGTASTSRYVVTSDQLILDVLVPAGAITGGVVGTWMGESRLGAMVYGHAIEVRDDATMTYTWTRSTGPATFQGTWMLDGDAIRMVGQWNEGEAQELAFHVVAGELLGQRYERQRN